MNVRISGVVIATARRHGTAKATGNPYDFTEVTILVGTGIATVTGSTGVLPVFTRGDLVDILAEAEVYAGRLSLRYLDAWDDAHLDAAASVVS